MRGSLSIIAIVLVLLGLTSAPAASALDVPSAPTSVTATSKGVWKVEVRWHPPGDPGSGVTGYRITVSPGDRVYDTGPDARAFNVSSLSSGKTYTFTVRALSADGAGPGVSKRLIGTKVTLSPATKAITWADDLVLAGKLTRIDSGSGLPNKLVELWQRIKGQTDWGSLEVVPTTSTGSFRFEVWTEHHYNSDFRVRYDGFSTAYMGGYSNGSLLTARPKITAEFEDSTVAPGQFTMLSGRVYPVHSDQSVLLQRYVDGAWATQASEALVEGRYYEFRVRHTTAPRTYSYRVTMAAHTDHASGASPTRKLYVE